jgi:uncharacterized membrane protein YfcA
MEHWIILPVATLAAGFLRGVTGFGFALAAVPLYSMVVPPQFAVIMVQILQIAVAPVDIYHNRKTIDRPALKLLFLGALIGAPLGAIFAAGLSPDVMRILIAIFVFIGLIAIAKKLTFRSGRRPAIIAGAIAGLLAGIAAMPGPAAVAYFLGTGADKATSRSSLLVFFAGTAVFVLTTVLLTSDIATLDMLYAAILSLPALLLGTYLGTLLFRRLGDGGYRMMALGVMFLTAVVTGAKGLEGLIQ